MNKGTFRGVAPSRPVEPPSDRGILASRLIVFGHSYDAPYPAPNSNPYSGSWMWNSGTGTTDGGKLPDLLAGLLGIDQSNRFIVASYPACTAAVDATVAIPIPEEGLIEAVYLLPVASITGAATNYRQFSVRLSRWPSASQFYVATRALSANSAALNLTAMTFVPICDLAQAWQDSSLAYRDSTLALRSFVPVRGTLSEQQTGINPLPSVLSFESLHVASGLADTGGGTVVIRWGGNFRNLAVGSSRLVKSGMYHGGWGMHFTGRPPRRAYGIECNSTGTVSSTTVNVDALEHPIASGWKIPFSNGTTVTTAADANAAATTITATGAVTIPAGNQGYAQHSTQNSYASLTPLGLTLECHGRNDAAVPASLESTGWGESMRAVLALDCCPYFQPADRANIVAAVSAGGAWSTPTSLGGGQIVLSHAETARNVRRFLPTSTTPTAATLTIKLAPAYDGSPVDLFFMAQAGATRGGTATITADKAFNGGTACTINTSSACLNDNITSLGGGSTFTVSGTTTLTISGGSATWTAGLIDQVGTAIKATAGTGSIAAGTKISAISTSLIATLDTAGSNGTVTSPETAGYVPMVKRLTGMTSGSTTITITINTMDTATSASEFIFLGYGIEATSPKPPVVAVGICKAPADTSHWTKVNTLNGITQRVIKGTWTNPNAGNSLEPPLQDSVTYVDTDTPMGYGQVTANFSSDGIHLSNAGNLVRTNAVLDAIRDNYSAAQLMAV